MKKYQLLAACIMFALNSSVVTAGAISDVYTKGDVLTAGKLDNIKAAVNGNAGDISTNTTRISTLESATSTVAGGIVGSQITNANSGVLLDSTIDKSLLNITIPSSGSVNVALSAHVYIEKGNASTERYEFSIRASSCSGTLVGDTFWRPDVQTNGLIATTISLTGFQNITASTTYHLCARKFDPTAPDANVYMRGLNAVYK